MQHSIVACGDARKGGYHLALAVQEAERLNQFITATYLDKEALSFRLTRQMFPRVTGRYLSGLDVNLVCSLPLVDAFRSLSRFKLLRNNWNRVAIEYFDKWVSRQLKNQEWLFTINDYCSDYTLQQAKKRGIKVALLSVVPSNEAWQKIWEEELALHPHLQKSDDSFHPSKWILERREKDFILADKIIAYSAYIQSTLIESGVAASKVIVIPKGADMTNDLNLIQIKRDRSFYTKQFNILYVGALTWRKGIYYLLEAVKKAEIPGTVLKIIGAASPWLSLFEKYHSYFKIDYIGTVPNNDIGLYYTNADVFFFPSLLEGSAQVTIEAMAYGIPTLTTPNSGSFIEDECEGFIVPIRNIDAMAKRLVQLYENPELRSRMSVLALEKAKKMTWEKFRQGIQNEFFSN